MSAHLRSSQHTIAHLLVSNRSCVHKFGVHSLLNPPQVSGIWRNARAPERPCPPDPPSNTVHLDLSDEHATYRDMHPTYLIIFVILFSHDKATNRGASATSRIFIGTMTIPFCMFSTNNFPPFIVDRVCSRCLTFYTHVAQDSCKDVPNLQNMVTALLFTCFVMCTCYVMLRHVSSLSYS